MTKKLIKYLFFGLSAALAVFIIISIGIYYWNYREKARFIKSQVADIEDVEITDTWSPDELAMTDMVINLTIKKESNFSVSYVYVEETNHSFSSRSHIFTDKIKNYHFRKITVRQSEDTLISSAKKDRVTSVEKQLIIDKLFNLKISNIPDLVNSYPEIVEKFDSLPHFPEWIKLENNLNGKVYYTIIENDTEFNDRLIPEYIENQTW